MLHTYVEYLTAFYPFALALAAAMSPLMIEHGKANENLYFLFGGYTLAEGHFSPYFLHVTPRIPISARKNKIVSLSAKEKNKTNISNA